MICDSLGQGHADAVRAFERLAARKFHRILLVGGGSKNRLLCQATADASGLPVHAFTLEGTAVGNIASQLIGDALPPDMALRAVLDAAGALERLGRTAEALGVLSKAAESVLESASRGFTAAMNARNTRPKQAKSKPAASERARSLS